MNILLPVIIGCSEPVVEQTLSFNFIDGASSEQIELLSSTHTNTPMATARSLNAYNAAVSTEETISIQIEGEAEPRTANFDVFGYARIPLPAESPRLYHFSAEGSEESFTTYKLPENPTSRLALLTALPNGNIPSSAARGSGGYIFSFDNELWWQDMAAGSGSSLVLLTPNPILGLWSNHIDGDGILDCIVWTQNQAFLMRGNVEGGLSWGGGIEFDEGRVVAASVADLNGDRISDIAIGVTTENESTIAIFESDGNWNFSEGNHFFLAYPLEGMVAEDEDKDGRPDLSVIDESTGYIRRYTYNVTGWMGGTPSIIEPTTYIAPTGSHLPPMEDLNADGRKDLLIVGAESNNIQDFTFFIINNGSTIYKQQYSPFFAKFRDVDQNGSTDVLAFTDEGFRYVWYNVETGGFTANTLTGFGERSQFVVQDANDDSIQDLALFKENLVLYAGGIEEEGGWVVDRSTWSSYNSRFSLDYFLGDFNGDSQPNIVGFTESGSQVKLEVSRFSITPESQELTSLDVYTFPGAESEALDLVVCENNIVALNRRRDGNQNWTHELRVFNLINNGLNRRASRGLPGQLRADCASVGGQTFLAVGVGADWWILNVQSDLAIVDTGNSGDWTDIALGNIDNAGSLDVRGCSTENCQIDIHDLDGDGIDEVILNEGTISIEGWGEVFTLEHQGEHFIEDIDGNGQYEILVKDGTNVWVYRIVMGGTAPPFGLEVNTEFVRPPRFYDLDGDGIFEPIVQKSSAEIAHPKLQ